MKETITPAIKICDVRKRYGQHEVLQGIDMEVMPKEVVCLIGPSGSGKSTSLRNFEQTPFGFLHQVVHIDGFVERLLRNIG